MFINQETLKLEYEVETSSKEASVIDIMATEMNLSSRLIRKCKQNKSVYLNDKKCSVNAFVKKGDIIKLILDHDENTFEANPIEVNIIYEDGDILAVDKPPDLVVHPTKGHPEGTLANALSYYQYQMKCNYKIRFINRLDRDTSGIVLIAKNAFGQHYVSEQMQNNEVEKLYYAIVENCFDTLSGVINEPIDRIDPTDIRREVIATGMPSITHYEVLSQNKHFAFVRLLLETGRTHQIRVHLSYIGHPIVGDSLYGQSSELISRQALHCYEVSLNSPRVNEKIVVKADIPPDMVTVLTKLELNQKLKKS